MINNILYIKRQLEELRESIFKSGILLESPVKVTASKYLVGDLSDTIIFTLELTTGLYTDRVQRSFSLYHPCPEQYIYIRQALEREVEAMERRGKI